MLKATLIPALDNYGATCTSWVELSIGIVSELSPGQRWNQIDDQ